jgi:antitoxin (DNA-binding transcriptional repressor) of toxin-antitoxin stability system
MKRVPLAEFKAHCARYMDEVAGEEIVITKYGKAVARLSFEEDCTGTDGHLIGVLRGKLLYDNDDDLLSTGRTWEAQSYLVSPSPATDGRDVMSLIGVRRGELVVDESDDFLSTAAWDDESSEESRGFES